MKKILFLLLLSISSYAQTVHRVTNGMNLQTVIDNAVNGDMILVEGGNYGDVTINKALRIYGTGYLLNEPNSNMNLQATVSSSKIGNVNFISGSSYSLLSGFTSGSIVVSENNITVTKCFFTDISVNSSYLSISQSLFNRFILSNNLTSILLSNNIIKNDNNPEISIGTGTNVTLINNSFVGGDRIRDIQGNLGVFKNNIFFDFTVFYGYITWGASANIFNIIDNNNNAFLYNICGRRFSNNFNYGATYSNITNLNATNKVSQDFSLVYLAYPNNPNNLQEDARYQLATNSPAKGAGEGGTDCGAFGGDTPYVLSGIPSIPNIYQLTVPSQVPQNGTLNIQIKAKTNN